MTKEIEQLRKWSGIWTPKEGGKAEMEDQVIADVLVRPEMTDEEKAEQAKAAESKGDVVESETKLDNFEIYVRKNGFVAAVPVENLDELLVGAAVGDKKTTTVEVSKTYFNEAYRGRKVTLDITVKDIKGLKPAEMDENFLQRYGVKTTDDLKELVRDNLKARLESAAQNAMSDQIYQYLLSKTTFDLPLDIVGRQVGALLQRQYVNLLSAACPARRSISRWIRSGPAAKSRPRSSSRPSSSWTRSPRSSAVEVSEEEINGHIAQVAIQRGQRPRRLKEQMERDGSLAQFGLEVRQDKCINKILESADITEKEPSAKAGDVREIGRDAEKPKKATEEGRQEAEGRR